ncbi:MAG: hypothetical protein LBE60_08635 [Microbacterium sp.]|jgi:hypothetical protein|uniref:hypothetical protein n=1 Tax=Microbacterium sp. TaxID=51671 RepID=UPI0028273523|nr:hypothetical protein [Microbacterium sp.]MDR2321698.1 hypothetical protein [Microbacterium sp.]
MEQQSMRGAEPLEQPDAATAQAYLDVLPDVRRRAEGVLDLRRLGRLYVVEGVASALYVGIYLLAWGLHRQSPDLPIAPMNMLAVFLIWSFLARAVREGYGARRVLRGARAVAYYGLAVAGAVLGLALVLIDGFKGAFSWFWLPVPSLFFLAGALSAGLSLRYEGRNDPPRTAPAHAPFTRTARVGTLAVGACLAISVALSGAAAVPGWGSGVSSLGMCAVTVLYLVALLTRWCADLGEIWRAPQWTMFGVGASAAAAMVLLVSTRPAIAPATGFVLGAVVLILAAIVSRLPGRGDD